MSENPQVIHGDALTALLSLPNHYVDAIITDPPYNSGGRTASERRRQTSREKYTTSGTGGHLPEFPGDNRDQRSWTLWCTLWLTEALRVTVPGGSALVATDWRQLPATTDAVQAAGWTWAGIVTWVKPRHRSRPRRGGFWNQVEFWVWGVNGRLRADHEVYLPGVIEAAAPGAAEREHPTEKPLTLMRELVKIAPPGGLIFDPFAGSGTTGCAALEEGRRFLGGEISPHYVWVARSRTAAQRRRETLPPTRP